MTNTRKRIAGVAAATMKTPEPTFAEASVMPGDVTVRIYYDE